MLTLILSLLLGVPLVEHNAPPRTALASRYADTPRDEGGTPACWRRIPDAAFNALYPFRCAHRTLPCGTIVALRANPSQVAFCAVLDRGPWCRVGPGCKRSSRASGEGFEGSAELPYRGDLDLSPAVAERVGIRLHGGPGRVRVTYWPVARVRRERGGNS